MREEVIWPLERVEIIRSHPCLRLFLHLHLHLSAPFRRNSHRGMKTKMKKKTKGHEFLYTPLELIRRGETLNHNLILNPTLSPQSRCHEARVRLQLGLRNYSNKFLRVFASTGGRALAPRAPGSERGLHSTRHPGGGQRRDRPTTAASHQGLPLFLPAPLK